MRISDVIALEDFTLINQVDINSQINKLFASDLLSHAMGNAQENDLFITVLNNVNVLGVASLLDFSGVIFTHNISVNDAIIKKANELNIPLIKTSLSTVQVVIKLNQIGEFY
jgi:predicted transcriptional regulator